MMTNPLTPFFVVLIVAISIAIFFVGKAAEKDQPVQPVLAAFAQQADRGALAHIVSSRGYRGLTDPQKAACCQLYLADLQALYAAVQQRLALSVQTIPNFRMLPQHQQMNATLALLHRAIADLQHNGTRVDCTRYQTLINEVITALQR